MIPPLIAFPLLDGTYDNTTALLAGQRELKGLLLSLIATGTQIMATQKELTDAAAALHTELLAAFKREADAITAWQKTVDALTAAVATAAAIPDALLTQINADIAAAKAAVPAIPAAPVTAASTAASTVASVTIAPAV